MRAVTAFLFIVYISGGQIMARGRIQPAEQFNQTCQIPCKFFSSATFPAVDSSAHHQLLPVT